MSSDAVISVQNLHKTFSLPHERHGSIKSVFVNGLRKKTTYEKQKVLDDISFDVNRGEFFGIVGRNGSGKSTLLKILAGIYAEGSGSVTVKEKLTPFIELGVGFNNELTGRENIFLNGALLGFSRQEMEQMYDDIVAFAELEKFMDQKLKNYSSGMQVRLAFSVAVKVDSPILLLDEVLAVGDASFQKKCFDYFRKLKKDKKTVVFISHDMNAIKEYCDKAILLDGGKIRMRGTPDEVAMGYKKLFSANENVFSEETAADKRWGTGDMVTTDIKSVVKDKTIEVTFSYTVKQDTEKPIFGIIIKSPTGKKIIESNTKWQKLKTKTYKKGQEINCSWVVPNIFKNGTNYITSAISDQTGSTVVDWWEDCHAFDIDKDDVTTALTLPILKVKVK